MPPYEICPICNTKIYFADPSYPFGKMNICHECHAAFTKTANERKNASAAHFNKILAKMEKQTICQTRLLYCPECGTIFYCNSSEAGDFCKVCYKREGAYIKILGLNLTEEATLAHLTDSIRTPPSDVVGVPADCPLLQAIEAGCY
jgi:hypothetical protein